MQVQTLSTEEIDGIDDATAALILELQYDDIQGLKSRSKGKGHHDDMSDGDMAIESYRKEIEEATIIRADRSMARSFVRAVIADASLLSSTLLEENLAVSDRALAHTLARSDAPNTVPNDRVPNLDFDDRSLDDLAATYVFGRDEGSEPFSHASSITDSPTIESSTTAVRRSKCLSSIKYKCISCNSGTSSSDVFWSACGHHYCKDCIQTLFEIATMDETLFPPRCCRQIIPLASVKKFLSCTLLVKFEAKSVEFSMPDRTYCCQPSCSSFIHPDHIFGEKATCSDCKTSTCTICKNVTHDDDCPEDTTTQKVLETARQEGWQRCFKCRRLVELDIGCNHITYVSHLLCLLWLRLTKCSAAPAVQSSGTVCVPP